MGKIHVLGIPKPILNLDDSLPALTGPRKTIILMITVYYNERKQIKISKMKRHMGEVQEKPGTSFQVFFPSGVTWTHVILSAMMCDNTCKVLSATEAHRRLGVQDFCGRSVCRHATSLPLTSATPTPASPGQKQIFSINHSVNINYVIKSMAQGSRHP